MSVEEAKRGVGHMATAATTSGLDFSPLTAGVVLALGFDEYLFGCLELLLASVEGTGRLVHTQLMSWEAAAFVALVRIVRLLTEFLVAFLMDEDSVRRRSAACSHARPEVFSLAQRARIF